MKLKFFLTVSTVGLLLLVPVHGGKIDSSNNIDAPRSSRHVAGIASKGFSYRESLERFSELTADDDCTNQVPPELINEIRAHQDTADQIMELIVNGSFKGETYKELHELVDRYPIRQSGFANLEESIDYMMDRMKHHNLENVKGEQVLVPHWVRGEESAEMLEPHKKKIPLLGLGRTIGTPETGISGQVIAVKSFAELDERKDEVAGKIVVYNQGWLGSYGETNVYRTNGASHASQYGAIGALIQSVAPFSLNTPHTGGQNYWSNVTHIPVACITMEDADFIYRLHKKGSPVTITLKLLDYNLPMTTSRNVIGEIPGKIKPTEYVAVSGHIDSWDVGQGAMDDAGGVMISVVALAALKHLNFQPSRTLQAILWTSEEVGLYGVQDFVRQHEADLINYSAVFESDSGTFKPRGLDFAGTLKAGCIVKEVLQLTAKINTTTYARYPTVSSDITHLIAKGVPGLSLNSENDEYFFYHHTEADTITMMDSEELDLDTALWAVTSFVIANITDKLPREIP